MTCSKTNKDDNPTFYCCTPDTHMNFKPLGTTAR
jgi:hypothetical protein